MKESPATPETDPRFPSGPWVGFWIQKYEPRGKHQTELGIQFAQGVLSGEGRDWVGQYIVRGRYEVESGRCHFTKTYIGKHSVFYDGYNEGKGIWGTWSMESGGLRLHGGFHIWPKGMHDPSELTLKEAADVPVEFKEKVTTAEPVRVGGTACSR